MSTDLPNTVAAYFDQQVEQARQFSPDGLPALPDVVVSRLSILDDADDPVEGFVIDVRIDGTAHRIHAVVDSDGELTGVLDDAARVSEALDVREDDLNSWTHAMWWASRDAVFLAGLSDEALPEQLSELAGRWG